MNCPVCKISLVMSDRNGVEIDYCPSCRGVWLDRGELDKIIERSGDHSGASAQHHQEYQGEDRHGDRDGDDYHDKPRYSEYEGKKRKKENFLGELFDF
jgi:uncharacterized protein